MLAGDNNNKTVTPGGIFPERNKGVGGVTAAVTGDPAVFVSVSAAHQGPDGGGPVAAIVDLS